MRTPASSRTTVNGSSSGRDGAFIPLISRGYDSNVTDIKVLGEDYFMKMREDRISLLLIHPDFITVM